MPSDLGSERFSELWVLDSKHSIKSYPLEVEVGDEHTFFVDVTNHIGNLEYYKISLKFSNSTEFLPDVEKGSASSLVSFYEQRFFIDDGKNSEFSLQFKFENVSVNGNVFSLKTINVNGTSLPIDASGEFDENRNGYYFMLLFELWRYNPFSKNFVFDNRYATIWFDINA